MLGSGVRHRNESERVWICGLFPSARRWYREALLYDPEHRPALEYQGERFMALGDVVGARQNLRYLELLCTAKPCAEYALLKKALDKAGR
jgi:hypothetical protein